MVVNKKMARVKDYYWNIITHENEIIYEDDYGCGDEK
jgi:hypothetical protein